MAGGVGARVRAPARPPRHPEGAEAAGQGAGPTAAEGEEGLKEAAAAAAPGVTTATRAWAWLRGEMWAQRCIIGVGRVIGTVAGWQKCWWWRHPAEAQAALSAYFSQRRASSWRYLRVAKKLSPVALYSGSMLP